MTSDQGAFENFFKRIVLVETQSFHKVLITYFKMTPEKVILECRKEADSLIFTVYQVSV